MNSTPDHPVKRRPLKLFFCYANAVSDGGVPQADTFKRWRTAQLSDHLPLWVELKFPMLNR